MKIGKTEFWVALAAALGGLMLSERGHEAGARLCLVFVLGALVAALGRNIPPS